MHQGEGWLGTSLLVQIVHWIGCSGRERRKKNSISQLGGTYTGCDNGVSAAANDTAISVSISGQCQQLEVLIVLIAEERSS